MVQLTLPKNSTITPGKTWPRPAGAAALHEFRIYRWNPDDGANPRIDTYYVDRHDCGPMVLDALLWIKAKIDPTLTNYREIIKKYGKEYKFSAAQIAKIDPSLGIPVLTQEVCKDGRSREARQKSRAKAVPAAEVKKLSAAKKEPKKRKKLPTDKCGECFHERKAHKLSPKGAWMRCGDVSTHAVHPWVKERGGSGPCWCVRFKEKKK